MMRKLWTACAVLCLLAQSSLVALGQSPLQTPASGGASAPAATAAGGTTEVLTVAITGLDRLLSDINYVSMAAESPQGGLILGSMVTNFTQGIDRGRPLGVVVYLKDNVPAPIVMLPVTDLAAFFKGIEAFVPPPDVDSDGVFNLKVGNNLLFVRDNKQGWAFASTSREALDIAPQDPLTILGPLTKEHDIHFALNIQSIPPAFRQQLIAQITAGFEQTIRAQPSNDAAKEMSLNAARKQLETIVKLIDQSELLKLGLVINPNDKVMGFDVSFTAAEGTELAKLNAETQVAPSRFTSMIQPDAAIFGHGSVKFGPLTKKMAVDQMDIIPTQLKAALDSATDNGQLDKEARDFLEGLVQEILAISRESIDKGYSDSAIVVRTDNETLGVAAAVSPINGAKVEQLATKLKAKVDEKAPQVQIKLNARTHSGVNLHTIELPVPEGNDGARKVFGSKVQLLLGTSPEVLYIGIGPDGYARVKAAIDGAAQGAKPVPNQLPAQFQLSVLPILDYANSISPNPVVDMVLQKLREYPEHSELRFVSKLIPRGRESQLRIEEGLLHAIGTAAQAARQQPQF